MKRPFCPLCASEDDATTGTADDGRTFFSCSNRSHGSDPYIWEPSPPPNRSQRSDGLGAELDIWDKLLDSIPSGTEFRAYGDVEDEFFARYPSEAALLLDRYGHRWRDERHKSTQYSMSAYLASRLRELATEGILDLKFLPA